MGVCDVVRDFLSLLAAVQGRGVVQVGQRSASLGELAGVEVRFGQPVTGQLVEGVAAVSVIGGGAQHRHGIPPGAVGNELVGTQVIGFHVVAPHVGRQVVHVVVGGHRAGIVAVVQGGQGLVGPNLVVLLLVVVFGDVVAEHRGVVVQVEGQFRVIEIGIFLNGRVKGQDRGVLEGIHGRHLVLGLDVGVTQLVVGNLAQGIHPVRHHGEILHRALPVFHGIQDRTGIEPVAAVHPGFLLEDAVVVGTGFFGVAHHQVRLAQDAGQVRPALLGHAVIQGDAVFHHVAVVFLHELALQQVVVGQIRKARVLGRLFEPGAGLREVFLRIGDVTQGIAGRSRIVRERHSLDFLHPAAGVGQVSPAKVAVGAFKGIFRQFIFGERTRVNEHKLQGGGFIIFLVEGVQRHPVMDAIRHPGSGKIGFIRLYQGFVTGGLEGCGAKDRVPTGFGVVAQGLEQRLGTLIHSPFIQADCLAHDAPGRAVAGLGSCAGKKGCGQHCRHDFSLHIT